MTGEYIDLAAPMFWIIFAVAAFLLIPLGNFTMRKWEFAGVNVLFLALLLKWSAISVVGVVLLVYVLLKLVSAKRWAGGAALLVGLLFTALFLIHKMPWLAGMLYIFKFKLSNINPLLAGIGFSYIFLRMLELLRGVFEGRHRAPDLPSLVNYLLPFHMLAAGPIQSYDEFVAQPPVPKPLSPSQALTGFERIAWGLFKKFVLAYALQKLFLTGFLAGGWYFVFEVQIFAIWLFLDFSAISDIAVGIGRIIGIATPENFRRPYFARNMINFWERWHISLGQWVKRNLFIPVQLLTLRRMDGKRPLFCASIAFTIAFLLCGLWHGIDIGFFIWGMCHSAGLVVTNIYRYWLARRLGAKGVKKYMKNIPIRAIAIFLTFEFTSFALVPVGIVMRGN